MNAKVCAHSSATTGLNISSLSFKVIQHHVVCDVSKKKEVCFRFYFPNATESCVQGCQYCLLIKEITESFQTDIKLTPSADESPMLWYL